MPWGASVGIDDEYFTYAARPDIETGLFVIEFDAIEVIGRAASRST
jgi:hypothetical protein